MLLVLGLRTEPFLKSHGFARHEVPLGVLGHGGGAWLWSA